MFLRQIRRIPVFFGIFASYAIYQHQKTKAMNSEFKNIQDKDLSAYLINPEIYANSLIFFDSLKRLFLPYLPKAKFYQVFKGDKSPEDEVQQFMQQYDMVAINSEGDCRPFKILKNHDMTRLQNFFQQISVLENIQQLQDLLKEEDNKLVLSYLPIQQNLSKTLSGMNEEKEHDFDVFRKANMKDLNTLEQVFKELRYRNLDKTAGHMIIRDADLAQQFGLSKDDAGQIYVIKKASVFSGNESSFKLNQVEYSMTRIEPDSSLESADEFQIKKESDHNDFLFKLLNLKKRKIATNQMDINKILRRLSLRLLPYVSHVYSDQQLNNLMILARQMNIGKVLVYGLQNEDNLQKVTKKLVNLKRSLNTHQQEQVLILMSENIPLLHKYFGIINESSTMDTIRQEKLLFQLQRLLNLEKPRFEEKKNYETIQLSQGIEKLQDIQEEIHQKSLDCLRYRYFGKMTTNRLKYLLNEAFPELYLTNVIKPKEEKLFETYSETTNYSNMRNHSELLTSSNIEEKMLEGLSEKNCLVYFYKPHCGSCYMMSKSYDDLSKELNKIKDLAQEIADGKINYRKFDENLINRHRIQDYKKFLDLRIFRYNIFNENKFFQTPTKVPGLYYFKNGKVVPVEFLKHQINPNDSQKLLWLTIRVIDSI